MSIIYFKGNSFSIVTLGYFFNVPLKVKKETKRSFPLIFTLSEYFLILFAFFFFFFSLGNDKHILLNEITRATSV